MKRLFKSLSLGLAAALFALPLSVSAAPAKVTNVVLVHGAWADGSGWKPVYDELIRKGYTVSVVANPLTSLEDDVASVDRVLARQKGPAILVGHSFGGAIISEAGDHPNVAGLVYVEAFVPDVGESALGLIPKDGPQPPLEPTPDGFAFFQRDAFIGGFAAGIDKELAGFYADSQVPISFKGGTTPLTVAAWKTKPSWYQVAQGDLIIPPAAQRQMAARAKAMVVEVPGGHLAFIIHAKATADLIDTAAQAASK